jgi:hypothetical protein
MSSYYRSILNVQAVAPAFLPTDISGCQLWLDAADATTIAIGTGVSQWDDKSGNARHAVQSVGANQPAYTTAGLNGLNVLTFNGSSHRLDNTNLPLQTAKTMFMVSKASNSVGGGLFQFRGAVTSSARQILLRELVFSGINFISGDFTTTNQSLASAPPTSWQDAHITQWTQVAATRNISYFLNNSSLTVNGNPPQAETNTLSGYKIGAIANNTEFFPGIIAEIIFYNRDDLSASERNQVYNYLAAKWNI